MRDWLEEVAPVVARLTVDRATPIAAAEVASLERWAETLDLDRARSRTEVLTLCERLLRSTVRTTHPRCFGWFTPTVLPEAALADLLVSLVNPQLAVRASSPAPVAIEERILRDLARYFGLPTTAGGAFTSGGSEASTTAVVVALTSRFPGFADGGLASLGTRPTLYTSAEGHRSLEKIAHAAGLGRAALRVVPVNASLELDVAALERQLAVDRAAGHTPFLVAATAGTTNAGAIDPMASIADLCEREGLWLHVDAAWGGAAAISPRLRPLLDGIERADSITFDPHKGLAMPLGTGVVLLRDSSLLRRTFCPDAPYVLGPDVPQDPYCSSLPWSRRFIGLRLLLPLLLEGWQALASRFERQVALAGTLAERLPGAGWQVLHASPLGIVCFADPGRHSVGHHGQIARRIVERGRAWITTTAVAGRPALRACVTSHAATSDDIDALLDELEVARHASR